MSITRQAPTPQLIYLVYGACTYHQEAIFSIASALAGLRKTPGQALDIQVFTDKPEHYRDLPVRVREFDESTRQRWIAPHGYHFVDALQLLFVEPHGHAKLTEIAVGAGDFDGERVHRNRGWVRFEHIAPYA